MSNGANIQYCDRSESVAIELADTFDAPMQFELSHGQSAEVLLRWKKLSLCKVLKRNGNFSHFETVLLEEDGTYPRNETIGLKIFAEREYSLASEKWLELLHKVPEHLRMLKNKTARRWVNKFAEVEPGDTSTFTRVC